jgi:hypothetical protein
MAPSKPTTALARVEDLPQEALANIEELTDRLQALQARVNLVSPIAQVDSILPMHKVSLRAVVLDPTPDGGDVYQDRRFCKDQERALNKNALMRIMGAAGAQLLETVREDDRSDPYYAEVSITIGVRDFDGTTRTMKARKETDLRDGAPETMKPEWEKQGQRNVKTGKTVPLEPSALAEKRRHILPNTETKALERALRAMFSLKHKYTVDELAKPFVVPKLVPALDPSDPDQKRALIAQASGADMTLFGSANVAGAISSEPSPEALAGAGQAQLTAGVDPAAPDGEKTVKTVVDTNTGEVLESETIPAGSVNVDTLEAPPPQEAPPVCTCPCGHEEPVTKPVAEATIANAGAPRCAACYPWNARFDAKGHLKLKDLGLPKRPGYTAKDAIAWAKEKAKGGSR